MGQNGQDISISFARKILRTALALVAAGLIVVGLCLPNSQPARASSGVSPTINFQGRLLTAAGAVIPDGNYNVEFKIYEEGDGKLAGDAVDGAIPAGTRLWQEDWLNDTAGFSNTGPVVVKNGYFSVNLGTYCSLSGSTCQGYTNSGVNFNDTTLWLSMNVAGSPDQTLTTCTPFSSCAPDGEMLPMNQMGSAPYAQNAASADQVNSYGVNSNLLDLASPTIGSPSPVAGGTLSSGQIYYYEVTAVNSSGETLPSASANATPSGGNLSVNVPWTVVPGATSYKIYRNTISNFTSGSLYLTTVANGSLSSYTDTGSISTTSGLPPTTVTGSTLSIQGWSGQTANLLQLESSTGSNVVKVDASGNLTDTATATLQGANALTLGSSSNLGVARFLDGTADGYFANLQLAGAIASTQTYSLPTTGGTICDTGVVCTAPGTQGNYLVQDPTTTGTDTITPTGGTTGLTVNGSSTATVALVVAQSQTADGEDINFTSATNNALAVTANSLTTGSGISVSSTNTALTSGSLLKVASSTTGAVTNGIVVLSASGNYTSSSGAGLLNVTANATTAGTVANISGTGLTSGTALAINAGAGKALSAIGNVSIQTSTNSTTAFQIQNASGEGALTDSTVSPNLISDGSFETTTANPTGLSGWSAKAGATVTQGSNSVYGTNDLDASLTTTQYDGVKYPITLTSGHKYVLTFFAKLITAGFWSGLDFGYSPDGTTGGTGEGQAYNTVGATISNVTVSNGGWYRESVAFTPGASSGSPYIYMDSEFGGTAHEFQIDGVELEDITSLPSTGSPTTTYNDGGIQLAGPITTPLTIQGTGNTADFQVLGDDDSTDLVIDSLHGTVGIGTSTPQSKLQVQSGAANNISTYSVVRGIATIQDQSDGGSAGEYLNLLSLENNTTGIFTSATPSVLVNNEGYVTMQAYTPVAIAGAGVNAGTTFSVTGALGQTSTGVAGGTGGVLSLAGGGGGNSGGSAANANGGGITLQGGAAGTGGSGAAGSIGLVSLQDSGGSVDIGNVAGTVARNLNVFTGNSSAVDTINVGTGNTTVAGGKTVNIANGTPTGSGTNLVTIGSLLNASTTTIQGGTGASAVNLQSGVGGTVTISSASSTSASTGNITLQSGNATVGSSLTAGTIAIDTGQWTNATAGSEVASLGDVNANTIDIGSSSNNATVIVIGKNSKTSTLSLKAGGGTLNLSTDGTDSNVVNISNSNFAANTKTYTINIGDPTSTGNTGDVVNTTIGPSASLTGGTVAGATVIQAQGLSQTITASATNPTDVIQTATNSTGAFQVQDSAGAADLLAGTSAPTNFLTDPDFAVATAPPTLNDWTQSNGATITQNTTAADTYEGLTSMKVVTSGANQGATTSSFTPSLPTGSGTVYTVSFEAMMNSGSLAANDMNVAVTGGGAPSCTGSAATTLNSTGFQQVSCTLAATTGTITALTITETTGTLTMYIDDVQLQSGTVATAFQLGTLQLRGVITNPVALQSVSNSTSAFQVQATGGSAYLTVDTADERVYVGPTAGDTAGALLVVGNKTTSGDPAGVVGALYYNQVSQTFRCDQGQLGWTNCLGVPKPNTRRWAYLVPEGLSADNFMNLEGDVDNVDNNAPTVIAATTSAPTMLDYATATSTNNYDNLYGQPNYNSSANPDFQAYLKLTATTNIRIWSGLTSDGGGTMEGSANPAGNYAAFRYDTSASDTDYECITKDGTTQTITSSGIAPGTTGHKLEVILTLGSTNAQFLIDGAIVCNNTTHLPAASTMMRYDNEVTTLTAAAAHMQLGWVYVESNQ